VVGVPHLGGLLAVAMPDQPDEREIPHVVLGIVLFHRGPERRRRRQVLSRGEGLAAKHEGEMLGEGDGELLPGRLVDRSGEIDAGDFGAERGMKRGDS
jgi:hypothetical protein